MQSYTGRLQELGQATIIHRTRHSFSKYSYLQVGDTMVKNIACWYGLDGKLQQQLGEEITLYTKNGFVEAFKTSDGKTYSGEKTNGNVWILIVGGVWAAGIGLGGVGGIGGLVLTLALVFLFFKIYKFFDNRANEGSDLPNAIRIPKA